METEFSKYVTVDARESSQAAASASTGPAPEATVPYEAGGRPALVPERVSVARVGGRGPQSAEEVQTLLRNRPLYPNVYTADAVATLTHEMMHALGIRREAAAECFGMQLTPLMARELGVPKHYAIRLGQLSLENYSYRPANYRDLSRCHEDGAWDLFPHENSPPWHG